MFRNYLVIAIASLLTGCAVGSQFLYVEPNPDKANPGEGYVDFFVTTPTVECTWQVRHMTKGKNIYGQEIDQEVRVDSHAYLAEIVVPSGREVRAAAKPGPNRFSISATTRILNSQSASCSGDTLTVVVQEGLITPVSLGLGSERRRSVVYDPIAYVRKEATPYHSPPGESFELEMIRLAAKANPNSLRPDGTTALIRAARAGRSDLVQLLLEANADANIADGKGATALVDAAQRGFTDIVKMLLRAGANSNASLPGGQSALALSLQNKHPETSLALIDARAEVAISTQVAPSPLVTAATQGYLAVVQAMLKSNPQLAADARTWNSALLAAIDNGFPDVVRTLLNATDAKGHKPENAALARAVTRGDTSSVELLLATGIDVAQNLENGNTLLVAAATNKHVAVASLLIRAKVPVNSIAKDGSTALMWAASVGSLEIVRDLVANRANPNIRSVNGLTALAVAQEQGHESVIGLLAPITSAQSFILRPPSPSTQAAQSVPVVPMLYETTQDGLVHIRPAFKEAALSNGITDVFLKTAFFSISGTGAGAASASARGKIVSGTLYARDAAGNVLPITAGMTLDQLFREARTRNVLLQRIGFDGFRIGAVEIYCEAGKVGEVVV
jgi:ankyrin repeat protein